MPTADTGKPRARRGFAAMNPERRREIARKGGASVPARSAASPRIAIWRPPPAARAAKPAVAAAAPAVASSSPSPSPQV